MKHIVLYLMLTSCTMTITTPTDFTTIEGIFDYCLNDIEYLDDKYAEIKLQYPEETMKAGTGDCEDKALLFLALVNKHLQIKGKLVLQIDHALTFVNGKYYDPTNGLIFTESPGKIVEIINYDIVAEKIILRRFD